MARWQARPPDITRGLRRILFAGGAPHRASVGATVVKFSRCLNVPRAALSP